MKREVRPAAVKGSIARLPEIYKLVGVPELVTNEAEYIPTTPKTGKYNNYKEEERKKKKKKAQA